jgi:hypothetical protein
MLDHNLPADVASEVDQYIAEGCPGDLNDYLDGKNIAHPQFQHHILNPGEEPKEGVVECAPGFYGTWVQAKDGHWWSTCVPVKY